MIEYTAVFVLGFITDLLYTYWVRAVARRRRLLASLASAGLVLPSALSLVVIVDDLYALIPYALGLALGTWVAMGKVEHE